MKISENKYCLKSVVILLLLIMGVTTLLRSQEDRPLLIPKSDLPNFYLDILNFPIDSGNASRLDIYIQVPYEMLSFVKSNEQFSAKYEITVSVFNKADSLVSEKLWTEEIVTNDYHESTSPIKGKISYKNIVLLPAEYNVLTQVRDVETKKINQIKRDVWVTSFHDKSDTTNLLMRDGMRQSVSMSGIMVVAEKETEGDNITVIPNVAATIRGDEEKILFYFEGYASSIPLTTAFYLNLKNKFGDVVRSDTLEATFEKTTKPCFMDVSGKGLPAGEYTVELCSKPDSSNMNERAIISRKLFVKIAGLPFTINDLDAAVEQLQYVAKKDTLDEMRNAKPERKREMFLDFWKKRDPTQGTVTNELMVEYYQRVEYANKNFSHYIEGWKSDRGNVYIVFGEPNNIERHPFELDSKPYEVWSYYELNREFVFVDETGFGDYRLRNPLWDVWRTRNR